MHISIVHLLYSFGSGGHTHTCMVFAIFCDQGQLKFIDQKSCIGHKFYRLIKLRFIKKIKD